MSCSSVPVLPCASPAGDLYHQIRGVQKSVQDEAQRASEVEAELADRITELSNGESVHVPEPDETVTQTGENAVKSKGIWSFVKGLFDKLSAVATSGSYNDLTNTPTIPDEVTEETVSDWGFLKKTWTDLVLFFAAKTELTKVVELDEATKKLFLMKDGVRTETEITSWNDFYDLTVKGLVRLYYIATGSGVTGRKALYTPHLVDAIDGRVPAILFDATGFIGNNQVWTRTITMTKIGDGEDGGINVSVGTLAELAKKTDIPTSMPWNSVTNKPSVFPPKLDSQLTSETDAAPAKKVGDELDVVGKKWHWFSATNSIGERLLLAVSPEVWERESYTLNEEDLRAYIDGIKFTVTISDQFEGWHINVKDDEIIHRWECWHSWSSRREFVFSDGYAIDLGANRYAEGLSPEAIKSLFSLDSKGKPVEPGLIDLFGESNSQMVATIKKYGAPQYKKDEHGEWYQEVEI